MDKNITQASRFMSLLLRHRPDTVGLQLDKSGWASIEQLVALTSTHNVSLTETLIKQIVELNDKQRFSISDDGYFVRANQGHSFAVELGLESLAPPDLLYHGTATGFLSNIREQGLQKGNRQHVHLSTVKATATDVGRRHGNVALLMIRAGDMHKKGFTFFQSKNGVWLTDHVPYTYVSEITR